MVNWFLRQKHRTRFIIALMSGFLMFSVVGIYHFMNYGIHDSESILASRVGTIAARVGAILERSELPDNEDVRWNVLNTLLADPAIVCASIEEQGRILLTVPFGTGCLKGEGVDFLSLSTGQDGKWTLIVAFVSDEIHKQIYLHRDFVIVTILFGLLFSLILSWFVIKYIIRRPVHALVEAIRKSAESGRLIPIEMTFNDQLDVVISAYNDVQLRLNSESRRCQAAFERFDYLYNKTPALLYSADEEDRITYVSDYWLLSTGYERPEVIGRPISNFLTEQSAVDYQKMIYAGGMSPGKMHEIALQLIVKSGTIIDVFLTIVSQQKSRNMGFSTLCVMNDVSQLKRVEQKLRRLVVTDYLSELPNRVGLMDHLAGYIANGNHIHKNGALIFVDLDHFKWINDTYGHAIGDLLLVEAGLRLTKCSPKNGYVARVGGDEFVIVCHDLAMPSEAEDIAQNIIDLLEKPFQLENVRGFVSASIGIAYFTSETDTPEEILRLADLAMYDSKNQDRGRYTLYSESLGIVAKSRSKIEGYIREGLDKGWFSLYLQPIVNLHTMKLSGAEALLRLNVPDVGMISPAEFISVAEETGQITVLGDWVIRTGVACLNELMEMDETFYLSINISPLQFNDTFLDSFISVIDGRNDIASRLLVEITETTFLRKEQHIDKILTGLRNHGVRIALDDFGTGYSSMSYLSRFPVDIIKLDHRFISKLGTGSEVDAENKSHIAVVRATKTLASELGLGVIAEGIETGETVEFLRELKIQYGQGYLFSPPMPVAMFKEWATMFGNASHSEVFVQEQLKHASSSIS